MERGTNHNTISINQIRLQSQDYPRKNRDIAAPSCFQEMEATIKKIKPGGSVVILEVPLLFESGFYNRFDRTITVYTNQQTALNRLKKKGISSKDALARLHSQMDIREKKRLAD